MHFGAMFIFDTFTKCLMRAIDPYSTAQRAKTYIFAFREVQYSYNPFFKVQPSYPHFVYVNTI